MPFFKLKPPVTKSSAKSKLPSKSKYFVLENDKAVFRAAEILMILSSLHPHIRSILFNKAMFAIFLPEVIPPHFINFILKILP